MADLWLDGIERIPGNSAGAMDGDGSRKALVHSTEGTSIEGAVAAYRANNSWPTFTVDCPERRAVEHLPLNVAARSLRNASGGVETNREGTILVQFELVGSAGNPASIGSPDDLDWFGREILGPVADLTGIPLTSTVTWVSYPASYGLHASQRLSASAWDSYNGVLGHQHAPENDHGDPGAINIARILNAASSGGDDLTPDEHDWLENLHVWNTVMWEAFNMPGQATTWGGNLPGRMDALYNANLPKRMDELEKAIADLTAMVAELPGPGVPGEPGAQGPVSGTFTGTVELTPVND